MVFVRTPPSKHATHLCAILILDMEVGALASLNRLSRMPSLPVGRDTPGSLTIRLIFPLRLVGESPSASMVVVVVLVVEGPAVGERRWKGRREEEEPEEIDGKADERRGKGRRKEEKGAVGRRRQCRFLIYNLYFWVFEYLSRRIINDGTRIGLPHSSL